MTAHTPRNASHPAQPTLDWDTALERVAQSREILNELTDIFIEQWPEIMDEIEQGVARQDYATLHRAAHTLKGSASIFGAQPVMDAAARLAQMGKNRALVDANNALRDLQDEMDRLLAELQAHLKKGGSAQ